MRNVIEFSDPTQPDGGIALVEPLTAADRGELDVAEALAYALGLIELRRETWASEYVSGRHMAPRGGESAADVELRRLIERADRATRTLRRLRAEAAR